MKVCQGGGVENYNMKIVALIIAKGDSKRLKNKNWRCYLGKPMIQHNLEKCLMLFNRVYVSSDFEPILGLARRLGAIPIKRPVELCGDVPNIIVYQHALRFMDNPNAIVAIQANSPEVDTELIEEAKYLIEQGEEEVKTCHNDSDKSDYGSIWAMTTKRLLTYPNPYKANPTYWIKDESKDIHVIEDICQ